MNGLVEQSRMTDVYVARSMSSLPGPRPGQFGDAPADCFRMHRVQWIESRVSDDGSRLICRFRAPDAESVRIALRRAGISFDSVWVAR